ncbi:MAG: hypothetical protein ACJ75J_06485 [Cytophagaceae bacterium]
MKKKITYLLTCALLLVYSLTIFRGYMPYLNYQVNYRYISTVLCENKAKPVLRCDGKCHLQKELKKSAGDSSGNSSTITIQLELEDMPVKSPKLPAPRLSLILQVNHPHSEEKILSRGTDLFSPPPQI